MKPDAADPARAESARLDEALRVAHAAGDGARLAALYEEAAALKSRSDEPETALFLTVQAYIHALEQGAPAADRLRAVLVAAGREA